MRSRRGVLVLADGTTVVTGRGGPNLPGGYIQGVTAGYSPNGTLLWEAFSKLATVWATSLPNGDVCATGGYDALITCWRPSGGVQPNQPPIAVMSANPLSGTGAPDRDLRRFRIDRPRRKCDVVVMVVRGWHHRHRSRDYPHLYNDSG